MVLRAFAVHPEYKSRPEIIEAGSVLKSRILKADKYSDRKAKSKDWIPGSGPGHIPGVGLVHFASGRGWSLANWLWLWS
jgi:hypothetical protein